VSALVPIALFGWIPLVILSFTLFPPRKAVIAAYLVGWLLLPVATYDLPGFPDYGKGSATNVGVALGALIFDTARVRRLRWRWLDWAVLVFCISPFLSSMSNGLGLYDGISTSLAQFITWGIPYAVGRAYFADGPGLEALALGVVIGGLCYVPLCLWEIRMSPQLHYQLYGYSQHSFGQTIRGGGYRPMVFLQHGLAVGLWMAAASVVAFAVWRWSGRKRLLNQPMALVALGILATSVLCKSTGATALLFGGLAVMWWTRRRSSPLAFYALGLLPFVFIPLRATGLWTGEDLVDTVAQVLPDRAQSLGWRFDAENLLSARARERWFLGWGGWGRSAVRVGEEFDIEVVTDSLWILVFGKQGALGLVAALCMLVLPVVTFARACPRKLWRHPRVAPALALAMALSSYMIDNLFNDMPNPLYMLIAGGLGAVRFTAPASARPRFARPAPARPASARAADAPVLGELRQGDFTLGAGLGPQVDA
jgi:hypothetical protein